MTSWQILYVLKSYKTTTTTTKKIESYFLKYFLEWLCYFFNIFPVLFKSKALYTKRFFCSCTCQRSQRTNYQVWNQPHNTPAVRQPHDTLNHSHPLGNAFKYAKGYTYPSLRTTPLHVIWSTACICEYSLWVTYTVVLHHTFCSKSPKALKPSVVMTQLRQFEGTRREWLILQECFGSRQHCVSLSILPSWWTLTSHNYMFLTQMHTWVCFISQTDHQGGSWATQTPSHQIFFWVLT